MQFCQFLCAKAYRIVTYSISEKLVDRHFLVHGLHGVIKRAKTRFQSETLGWRGIVRYFLLVNVDGREAETAAAVELPTD